MKRFLAMKKEIIINSTSIETRIALLEDGQLVELLVERPQYERNVGSIYKGVVRKVMPGMEAAFIDIGWEQDAFLHFSDLSDLAVNEDGEVDEVVNAANHDKYRNLSNGQEILVQIVKEPLGNKGPRVTTQVALPGRSVVLVPYHSHIGVSRRITDHKERRRLKALASKIKPEGFGVIVRTVAETKSGEDLKNDMNSQLSQWRRLEKKIANAQAKTLIFKDMSMASSVIRDLFTSDISSLVVDSKQLFRQINKYLSEVAVHLLEKVSLYSGGKPIFDHYDIESEIEKSLARKVWLEGGGYIIIEQTEALVTIDVNSGRFMGKQAHEDNSLKVNLRAAREITRQLKLRDLGGLIVIDFIDLWEERNRKKVYDEIRKELKRDRSKSDITPISQFGLMEMTRQRIKPSLMYTFNEPCPTCNGTGMVPSRETVSTEIERWVKRFHSRTKEKKLEITLSPELYEYMTQGFKNRVRQMMLKNGILIKLLRDESLKIDDYICYSSKQDKIVTDSYRY
ncbi:MAG: Rne/Rng family ribonuclease [candidate division Zixibacteria bacterium]|nr:Rne/Rng family ribonuclease [Candidatus Tariuqbacter arcticus]